MLKGVKAFTMHQNERSRSPEYAVREQLVERDKNGKIKMGVLFLLTISPPIEKMGVLFLHPYFSPGKIKMGVLFLPPAISPAGKIKMGVLFLPISPYFSLNL